RSALARGAAPAPQAGAALPARAPALVQPEVRARLGAPLCGVSERGHPATHRAGGDACGGLRDASLRPLAAVVTSALAGGLGLALASALALDVGFLIQQGAVARGRELSLRRPLASAHALFANLRWLT